MEDALDRLADLFLGEALFWIEDMCVIPSAAPSPGGSSNLPALRVEGGCVGLSSWALGGLYAAGKARLSARGDAASATALLAVQPEHGRAWAVRKRAFRGSPDIARELHFSALVLRRAPKSGAAWAHRAWTLRQVGWTPGRASAELDVARAAASRAPANYYAGVHRRAAIAHAAPRALVQELARSRTWLQTHVRDSSGWWFHAALLHACAAHDGFDVDEETAFVTDMNERYGERSQCVRQQLKLWRAQVAEAPGQ